MRENYKTVGKLIKRSQKMKALPKGIIIGGSDGKEFACNAGDPDSIPGSGRSPEKGRASHSSILAWRIPWTEMPGRPQSVESQRVGHD